MGGRQSFHSDRVIPGWRLLHCELWSICNKRWQMSEWATLKLWLSKKDFPVFSKTFSDAREKSCCVGSCEGSNGRLGTIWIFMLSVPGIGQVPVCSLFPPPTTRPRLYLSCFSLDEVCGLSCVWLFGTPWTVACQAPLSMGFFRQEYWSGLPFPPPEDLLDSGIEPKSFAFPALTGRFFATVLPGKPSLLITFSN